MVLKNHSRPVKRILLFFVLIISFSCEDMEQYFVNCSECLTNKPEAALLEIKTEKTGNEILINIYEGNVEDNILYESFLTISSSIQRSVPINKRFTLTATYSYEGNNYITVNSVMPRVKYTEDQCDDPCYFVYDKVVDLKLKYTK